MLRMSKIKVSFKYTLIQTIHFIFKRVLNKKLYRVILYLKDNTSLFQDQFRWLYFKNIFYLNLNLKDWIQNQIYFLGSYEEDELKVMEYYLKSGDNVLDIGANFGLYSFFSSYLVGENGLVISFEPFWLNSNSFIKNLEKNKSKNVNLVKKAVSDNCDGILLKYNDKESNLGMVSSYFENATTEFMVESITIDEYFLRNKLNALRYIKVDVEGGEYKSLLGMKNTLSTFKPILQIELDDEILKKTPYSKIDIYSFLQSIDYGLFTPRINNIKLKINSKNQFFRHNSFN